VVIVAVGGAVGWYWWQQQLNALPPYIAKTNGRLEAEQVEIATKYPGRIAAVFAKEGDMVHAGDVLARMDTAELEAQLQAAQAQVKKAEQEKIMAEASAWRVSDQRRPSWRPSQGAQRRDRNPASLTESRNKYQ